MIKVIEDKCEINGYKDDIMTEVQIVIMNMLTYLDPIDKSIEGEDNND